MKQSKLCIVLSDLHCGSTAGIMPDRGIMPEGFHTLEGNEVKLNKIQEWLMYGWKDCWEWFYTEFKGEPFDIIFNGDCTEAVHHNTKEVWSVNETDHLMAAHHLIKDHCKRAEKVYFTVGTEVHVKDHEHALAFGLKSKGVNVIMPSGKGTQGGAWRTLYKRMGTTLIKADHHITSSSRPYLEASQMSIHMGAERIEAARSGREVPKVYLRAHRHKFGMFNDGYGMLVITPPWQTKTKFGYKVVPHAVEQCGMVVLDWRNGGDLPVVHHRLHELQQPTVCK